LINKKNMKRIVNNTSKELIKARILKNAVKLWGVQNTNALDPFVTLLIDAFTTEIFKLNNEIDQTKGRILEKLARMLTPSIYTNAQPSHAIATVDIEESLEILNHDVEFHFKKILTSNTKSTSDILINIPFTAVDNINLINANISLIISNKNSFYFDEYGNKTPLGRSNEESLIEKTIFIGIDFSNYIKEKPPKNLSLYCENQTFENLEFVYNLLPYINVSTGTIKLKLKKGLTYPDKDYKNGFDELLDGYSIKNRIEQEIKNIYDVQFIELYGLNDDIENLIENSITDEIREILNQQELINHINNKKILWLKFEFPAQYNAEILEGFSFYLNAFPIYNRGWKKNETSLDIMGSNIPLVTHVGEYFLYVDEVSDNHGRNYKEILFSPENNQENGLFTTRKGGMERFNERNAIDMIKYVLELTRDEVSAFGILERDKVIESLTNMIYQMNALEKKANTVDKTIIEYLNYIVVEPFTDTELLSATYWVTHCEFANNIRKGTELIQQHKFYNNKNKKMLLITNSQGGEIEKKGTNAIQAYKYALTTRDRIVSNEDIKNFCILNLKQNCVDVNIYKGTIVSDKPKEGFIRTVNIEITVKNFDSYNNDYWITYAKNLKRQIAYRAIDGIEYVVSFKSNEI
jgi:hypothetical protein